MEETKTDIKDVAKEVIDSLQNIKDETEDFEIHGNKNLITKSIDTSITMIQQLKSKEMMKGTKISHISRIIQSLLDVQEKFRNNGQVSVAERISKISVKLVNVGDGLGMTVTQIHYERIPCTYHQQLPKPYNI